MQGAGYGAACYALAGRIDHARSLITALPAGERGQASAIVFDIGHPVADAGDDRSAGPIMELVLEFWPENYMALYHAGMSEYVLANPISPRLTSAVSSSSTPAMTAGARMQSKSWAASIRLRKLSS